MYESTNAVRKLMCPSFTKKGESMSYLISAGSDARIRYWDFTSQEALWKKSYIINNPKEERRDSSHKAKYLDR